MSETALIIRDDSKRSIAFTGAVHELRDSALAVGALVGRVANAEEQANAVVAQQEIARVLKLCEESRKLCKEPILDFGRLIDESMKSFREPLALEQVRIGRLVGDFAALELTKQRAAEAARRLEEEKLQREKEAEERRIHEEAQAAERKLRQAEAEARTLATQARNAKERAEAEARQHEIDRQRALTAAQTHEQLEAVQERTNQAAAALPVFTAAKAEGQSVREEWVIDLIDQWKLIKARPDLVRTIDWDMLAIKALLKSGVTLPGVSAHKETRSAVRAGRSPLTLEV